MNTAIEKRKKLLEEKSTMNLTGRGLLGAHLLLQTFLMGPSAS
jgi:hypothetical protein